MREDFYNPYSIEIESMIGSIKMYIDDTCEQRYTKEARDERKTHIQKELNDLCKRQTWRYEKYNWDNLNVVIKDTPFHLNIYKKA